MALRLSVFIPGILLMVKLSIALKQHSSIDCSTWDDKPLCGSNGVTYLNFCEFKKARKKESYLEIEHRGACQCTREERYEWDPICGTDSDSYANYCEFQKAKTYNHHLRLRHRDLCEYLMKKEALSYRELQKITRWKSFMPMDLYKDFMRRPVYGAPKLV